VSPGPSHHSYLRLGFSITLVMYSYSSCARLSEILLGGKTGMGPLAPLGSLGGRG
jgi:hypothetical protein